MEPLEGVGALQPEHIAIIMDGNGRWARRRHRDRIFGHIRGTKVAKKVIQQCRDLGIQHLTLYAFSTENWGRPAQEVAFLMRLLSRHLKKEKATLMQNNIRFRCIGDLEKIPADLTREIRECERMTLENQGMTLTFALSYGGRQEITQAAREMAFKVARGELRPEDITEQTLAAHLQTHPLPDPDLVIRTSGESRLSNFLPWQSAYSEIYIASTLWPDFNELELNKALEDFAGRQRRFGKIPDTPRGLGREPANEHSGPMRDRVVSAVVALLILAGVYFTFRVGGLMAISAVATLLAIREFSQLTFQNISTHQLPKGLFRVFCFLIYLGFTYWPQNAEALFAVLSILFVAALLTLSNKTTKLSRISLQQGLGIMGFVYCGLLPALATRILQWAQGDLWFFTLLAVIFVGDSAAYFVGRTWGRTKLMPQLSPSKTVRGAFGGLFGSMVAGFLASALFFPHLNSFALAAICVVTGCFAQVGDLFESLLKRVAQVKDSGHIMPGHGGVLDRLDGVLFGAPAFYYLIQLFYV